MNEYIDRGIIKWSPFDGLAGFNDLYKELKNKLGKKEKPTLSEDQLNQMDLALRDAVGLKKQVEIMYYEAGYTKSIFGFIHKVDYLTKTIWLGYFKIQIDTILSIETETGCNLE